jgi:GT2 family glycosyltransferase
VTPFRRRVVGREVQSHGLDWSAPADDDARIGPAPSFTLVVPVWNTDPDALRALFRSVRAQRYDAWDMSIVDDASTRPETRRVLDEAAADPRVRVTRLDRNSGIGRATGAGLARATGTWIAFVDHDDVLDSDALLDVARLVREVPDLEMVYTDQDRLRADGTIGDPSWKSAWSVDLLRSTNCIVHLCCYRRSLLDALGGIREGFDGSQDYDLLLRMGDTLDTTRIGHVARPRYHWRASAGSVASDPEAKPWAFEAARRALADSLRRRNMRGRVEPHDVLGWYHTRYEIVGRARATVVLIGDAGSALDTTRESVARAGEGAVAIVETAQARNGAAAAAVAASASTDLVAFVAAGVVVRPGWLDGLGEHAQRADVGFAGGRLLDDAGRPTFGLVVGGPAAVVPATPAVVPDDFAWSGRIVRNLSAVPLHLAATRPEVVRSIGWDDVLDGDAFAADMSLRARARGLAVVSTPHAEGARSERVDGPRASRRAIRTLRARWDLDTAGDPFLNPNVPAPGPRSTRVSIRRGLRAR